MPKEFWETRYGQLNYAYGTAPNVYFKKFIDNHPAGRIMLPGEGEGRNAVYAARKGWEVTAIDQSLEGKRKAEKLAKENQVSLDYRIGNLSDFPFRPEEFDAIALIFLHLPPENRLFTHKNFVRSLKPGGYLLVEAFSKDQLGRSSGGPPVRELLYDEMILTNDFKELNIIELNPVEEWLDEGPFHQGEAKLVRLMARK
ncbi:MAG: class I SAM-dependent methyltransferase [Cyclobacteriaceae bacterium]|nr:class I SAM-dependent methyltransferase [Cyclobacteriaceae bacterium]